MAMPRYRTITVAEAGRDPRIHEAMAEMELVSDDVFTNNIGLRNDGSPVLLDGGASLTGGVRDLCRINQKGKAYATAA